MQKPKTTVDSEHYQTATSMRVSNGEWQICDAGELVSSRQCGRICDSSGKASDREHLKQPDTTNTSSGTCHSVYQNKQKYFIARFSHVIIQYWFKSTNAENLKTLLRQFLQPARLFTLMGLGVSGHS